MFFVASELAKKTIFEKSEHLPSQRHIFFRAQKSAYLPKARQLHHPLSFQKTITNKRKAFKKKQVCKKKVQQWRMQNATNCKRKL